MVEQTAPTEEQEIDSRINKAIEAAKRLEEANAKAEMLLSRQILSGKSAAGEPQAPVQTEAEKKKLAAMDFFKGSAIAGAVKRYG